MRTIEQMSNDRSSEHRAMETGTSHLHVEVVDRIARVVLDNPSRHNALNPEMLEAIAQLFPRLDDDDEVRVIVVRGAGDRAFSSGVDTSVLGKAGPDALREFDVRYVAARRAVRLCDTPVIAMVHGHCRGGGLSLALEADLRLCSTGSQFAISAAHVGLAYQDPAPLVRAVGQAWAAELLFSGRTISSFEASQIGLVNSAVASVRLEATVFDLARSIAANAPLSLLAMKRNLRALADGTYDVERAALDALADDCLGSADLAEGLAAAQQRRPPRFEGR